MGTIQEKNFIDVFKGYLKINTRSISVKTLLSDRNLRRINYKPYYQRNYVWDLEKQTFFIESVILGTEIPPLILFKSSAETEVIDGRQRFETLRKFKDNEITLSSKGLLSLQALAKNNFNRLDNDIKDIFWNANIRVFEFEIVTEVSQIIEDKIKKEIFRRYNTGITPLTSEEIDNAKYDDDLLSDKFEKGLKSDKILYKNIKVCFFPNENDDASLLGKMVNYLRRLYILNRFPISRYASGSGRNEIFDILYETSFNEIENIDFEYKQFIEQLNKLFDIYEVFKLEDSLIKNKLIYESMFWAIRILTEEKQAFNIDENTTSRLKDHYKQNVNLYSEDNSFYYKNIIERFQDTANIYSKYFDYNFEIYLRDNCFHSELKLLKQSKDQAKSVMEQLKGLRINKPNPISKPVEEVLSDVISTKYLIRPSYQRQEKVTILKASSIIESILLGVYLPPIFIFKSENNIKEVVDGQQRLLSIIAFTGKQYRNEEDKLVYSKNHSFKLKGLKILTGLNGKNFSALTTLEQDKIWDFDIDEIIIEKSLNPSFDPTDLFIRLNQKPYPIKQNTFEMWNSTVEKDVIDKIKEVTRNNIDWFYFKECIDSNNRTDRMENEELITILAYISYGIDNKTVEKILGLFKRIDRVTCRLKNKTGLTDYLNKFEDNVNIKNDFLAYLNKTDQLIILFGKILAEKLEKETLLNFFNLKASSNFRKSFQDFYIMWLVLNTIDIVSIDINKEKDKIKEVIVMLLKDLRNIDKNQMDTNYFNAFIKNLNKTCKTNFENISDDDFE
jgi:hypothetical protein